ncbi:MAG: translation initiation factor [Gracilimonas sp.]|uniref:translation initiation factor n=1 Tax=Gracilimonas sp. TaxID=1974203 RepID=UPI0019A45EEC|nr:translation initiation factor [Gracilimonas sp.]MBD3615700.1 translation initiation factor [Gracilimonas sp.]
MKVTVKMETAGRRGKQVSVIRGITHNPQVIEKLEKKLKTQLGTGGTVKGKTIEIQGDHVERIKKILAKEGYEVS